MIYAYSFRRIVKMKIVKTLVILSASLLFVGCSQLSMHRVDVVQGNHIEDARLENLKPGMQKHEVQMLLGTPLVMDVYEPDVWYYVFHHSTSSGEVKKARTIKLHFDQQGRYLYLEGDSQPQTESHS